MSGGRRKWKAERKERKGLERTDDAGKTQKGTERSIEPPLFRWGCARRCGPVLTVAVPPRDVYRSRSGGDKVGVINLWCWSTTTQSVDDVQSEDWHGKTQLGILLGGGVQLTVIAASVFVFFTRVGQRIRRQRQLKGIVHKCSPWPTYWWEMIRVRGRPSGRISSGMVRCIL